MKRLTLTPLLIAMFVLSVHAQNSETSNHLLTSTVPSTSAVSVKPQDDPIAKQLEKAVDRLALAEAKNGLLEEKLAAKDDRISAKDAEIQALKDQVATLREANANRKEASTDRKEALSISDVRLMDCQNILAEAKARIHKLENPGFFGSLFKKETAYGFLGGYGVGRATASGNPFTR